MPTKNYKSWIIAVIVIVIIGVVIYAVTTSEHRTEKAFTDHSRDRVLPAGPVIDSKINAPAKTGKLPDNPQELELLGNQYFESGLYDKALEVYEKILQKTPGNMEAYNDMGLALHYMKRSDEAVTILKKGTQVGPSYQRIWLSLGFVLMSTGKNDEAKAALKRATALNPETDMGQEAKKMLGLLK